MIVMRLKGRLGNQLFIYAFGRALQEQYKQPLVLLDNVNDTGKTVLNNFKIPQDVQIISYESGYKFNYYQMKAEDYNKITNRFVDGIEREKALSNACKENNISNMSFFSKLKYLQYKVFTRKASKRECFEYEKKHQPDLTKKGLFICENGFLNFPQTNAKNIFGFGYFQSEKYFETIKDKIVQELKPIHTMNEKAKEFAEQIQSVNSVCLSIRMGDYLKNPVMGVCSLEYYQKAIDKIYELYSDAQIFVFSDDVEAVRKSFEFKNEVIFEPTGNNEWEKLTYMSMCKHFILSNSSFSWWVQYLAENPNKTVIAPSKWFAIDIPCDIYQNSWTLIEV